MNKIYEERRGKIYDWMAQEGIALLMFEDSEQRRDASVRWLSGHPSDALLFLSVSRQALLMPWDVNMASLMAQVDAVLPYTRFERSPIVAAAQAAKHFKIPRGSRIEIPSLTAYYQFLNFTGALGDYDVLCRQWGVQENVERLRAVKDGVERKIYATAARVTNELIELIVEQVQEGRFKTEIEAALFIEYEARKRGCEGTGFETLAAGPERSFGIHAFPAYTASPFAGAGLSILDFGLKYSGYTTDVTLTFARPPLSSGQEKMISLVERAYTLALGMVKPGAETLDIARAVDSLFAKAKKAMPHALGHGIGLEAHEAPPLRNRSDSAWKLEPGMIIALEPGLYDTALGGCRLENDILVTETGAEALTAARVVRL
ncbi:MAG: Xaa-Pro peptidase family protein [Spirochaetaceae bacterium]|jgi:Xaa-Pro dipeptidase|nr:Xaa-Pro peptidase family protein [Spirochaetaceae bacterium]